MAMHKWESDRVVFHSQADMAAGQYLQKGELVLRSDLKNLYTDINDVIELYHIRKYIDNEIYLQSWLPEDIDNFKNRSAQYGRVIGNFMSTIDDTNVLIHFENLTQGYIQTFWEIVNNQEVYKKISNSSFNEILTKEPYLIHDILLHSKLVNYFAHEIRNFLLEYPQSAEIVISKYEIKKENPHKAIFFPKNLTIEDKESILSKYLDSDATNLNYVNLIEIARNSSELKISDKTRLKAKRLREKETKKIFSHGGTKFGVSVSFESNMTQVIEAYVGKDLVSYYSYSLDYIEKYNDLYSLFKNFKALFEYTDIQNRINLVSRDSQIGTLERIIGVHSDNEYRFGTAFRLSEMLSLGQIAGYSRALSKLNISLEDVLNFVFTSAFADKYDFPTNVHFSVPSATAPYFEKVRLLAPEFESSLKQFKLFVEDGEIDIELLQMSSSPSSIKDIPSLNPNKYIYLNENNREIVGCINLFFSDQSFLTHVDPYKEKRYNNFFDLLAHEQVIYSNYEEHQKPQLNFLIKNQLICVNDKDIIEIANIDRLIILSDLHFNEVASFYHFPSEFQEVAQKMASENVIYFESSLFSRPEQSYFNYLLNKSEFTNGLDLRNSYLHGTQARPEEVDKHGYAYFTYMKLLFLSMLKMEDDLSIHKWRKTNP